jgi:sulfite reductase beta subunit-like hemoprotein
VGAGNAEPVEQLGEIVGRVGAEDVEAAVAAVVGLWEAVREPRESLGDMVARIGIDAVAAHLEAVMRERWATGPEVDEPEKVLTPT